QQNGLVSPPEVITATATYKADMDVLGMFFDECCVFAQGATVPATVLYNEYKRWSSERGDSYESQTSFGMQLTDRGFKKKRITSGPLHKGRTVYMGLKLAQ